MSTAVRRLASQLHRGLTTSAQSRGGGPEIKPFSHESIALGDGHHGIRPGYHYDYEHGPHYINPRKIPNFMWKWNVYLKLMFATSIAIPCFAVFYQQKKSGKW